MQSDNRLLLLSPDDNVYVLRAAVGAGETILVSGRETKISSRIEMGHKIARRDIAKDGKILKYGAPIGTATRDIASGEHVHLDNLKSDYTPTHSVEAERAAQEREESS